MSDLLAAFHELSDLLLSHEQFPVEGRSELGPLPANSPKRPELQKLWNDIALKTVAAGTDNDGNEEYSIPNFTTSAPEFVVPERAVAAFRILIANGRHDADHARGQRFNGKTSLLQKNQL